MVSRIHNDKLRTKQTFTRVNYFLARNKEIKVISLLQNNHKKKITVRISK